MWRIAALMKPLLEADGATVVTTKARRDERVTNRERAEFANRARADLFLRIHADAADDRGFATFYPDRAGRADGVTGPGADVLRATRRIARPFHEAVVAALGGKLPDRGLRTDRQTRIGGEQGALTGSVFSRVPVLLVEVCVLTDEQDERFAASAAGQEALAVALVSGVRAVRDLPR